LDWRLVICGLNDVAGHCTAQFFEDFDQTVLVSDGCTVSQVIDDVFAHDKRGEVDFRRSLCPPEPTLIEVSKPIVHLNHLVF